MAKSAKKTADTTDLFADTPAASAPWPPVRRHVPPLGQWRPVGKLAGPRREP